jgi:hypothetical protein
MRFTGTRVPFFDAANTLDFHAEEVEGSHRLGRGSLLT